MFAGPTPHLGKRLHPPLDYVAGHGTLRHLIGVWGAACRPPLL